MSNRKSWPRTVSIMALLVGLCGLFVTLDVRRVAHAQLGTDDPVRDGYIAMELQGDVPLEALIDTISDELGLRFIYNPEIGKRSVTVRSPSQIPQSSLLPLFTGILRMEGLALVDSDVPGWKRIVESSQMAPYAQEGNVNDVLRNSGPGVPVSQSFALKNAQASQMQQLLKDFLSEGSNVLAIGENNTLIVRDYAANIRVIARLIELIDQPKGNVVHEFYRVRHLDAATLTEQVRAVLQPGAAPTVPGAAASARRPSGGVELIAAQHGNQIVVVGSAERVAAAMKLLERLDIPLNLQAKIYRLRYVAPERLDKLIRGFISPVDSDRVYRSSVDEEGGLLVVTTTTEIHRRVEQLRRAIDSPVKTTDSPIQIYKLKNANAQDVISSLLALQQATFGDLATGGFGAGGFGNTTGLFGGLNPYGAGFGNQFGGGLSPFGMQGLTGIGGLANQPQQPMRLPLQPNDDGTPGTTPQNGTASTLGSGFGTAGAFGAGTAVATLPGGARISADVATNSLIVVAPPDVQSMYARLIESLDQRRPQVLIEAKIIAVDTTDDFSLGVEVSFGDRSGDRRLFNFTSFGLSQIDPTNGRLTINPGLGFNGALVDPAVADVVIQALAQHTRARVVAAPKILVNDNSTGELESVTSVPFSSVNASDTVATTSLGGDQQAGTSITVTPHINQDSHLMLEFDVEFSSFSGAAADGLPPPRQIDRVGSTVTIPDGQTVIVGGLKRVSDSRGTSGIPYLEHVPVLRELSSRNTNNQQTTSFFLFIRPKILRDDRFADLKYISARSASQAGIPGRFPRSRPNFIR